MAAHLTIGELAKKGEVPTSTVRYYERAGILRPSRRSGANYRLYSSEDLQRLRFVRAAQTTGFTLDDIKQLLRPARCEKTQALIETRLEDVALRMRELRHVQKVLRGALDLCREHEETGRCAVVETLSARARRS